MVQKEGLYRADIDGLRALAVVSVILYHTGFIFDDRQLFKGGFIGVDIFLVISGYLIASILLREYRATGRINLGLFYAKRVKRIVPPVLLVMFFSVLPAWQFLLPEQFVDYSNSILYSLLFSVNIYWDVTLHEYGVESTYLKPMLHLWSLSLEEQYYLVLPWILIGVARFTFWHGFLALLTIWSFSLLGANQATHSHIMLDNGFIIDSTSSFYMLPTRLWELMAGSILGMFETRVQDSNIMQTDTAFVNVYNRKILIGNELLSLLGLSLIAWSISNISFGNGHPGFITLAPVLGSLLLVRLNSQNSTVGKALSNGFLVGIGLISYELYLWHYPIFAFLRLSDNFELAGKLVGIITTLLLAWLAWSMVGNPIRRSSKTKIWHIGAMWIALLLLAIYSIVHHGFPTRFNAALVGGHEERLLMAKKYYNDDSAFMDTAQFTAEKTSIKIIGNSWAHDIAMALAETNRYEISKDSTGDCLALTGTRKLPNDKDYEFQKNKCYLNINLFKADFSKVDILILSDNTTLLGVDSPDVQKNISENIKAIRDTGYEKPIVVISNRPYYRKPTDNLINDVGSTGELVNRKSQSYLHRSLEQMRLQDAKADIYYKSLGVNYYSLVETFCTDGICKIISNNLPLYTDGAHLSLAGARFIGSPLSDYIDRLLSSPENQQ